MPGKVELLPIECYIFHGNLIDHVLPHKEESRVLQYEEVIQSLKNDTFPPLCRIFRHTPH